MRTRNITYRTSIERCEVKEGKSLEQQLADLTTTTETIDTKARIITTERKDGARPEFNIRADYYEIMRDKLAKVNTAIKLGRDKPKEEENEGGPGNTEQPE